MRGAAQAHLLECDDGHFYVVKFRNNPQHGRMLVNEWLASSLLACLKISTPPIAIVHVSADFLACYPEVHIQLHAKRLAVEPGPHFGSQFPGNPSEIIIYDFMPDVLFDRVTNRSDFLGAYVLDKWTGNADARQAIFSRPGIQMVSPSADERPGGFSASMIDQGYAFGGPEWRFLDSPLQGLYHGPDVYQKVSSWDDFQPWLDRAVTLPVAVVDEARKQIPREWTVGENAPLDALLVKLLLRRKRLPDLIADSVRARKNSFPGWEEQSFVTPRVLSEYRKGGRPPG
jgi:hypothetical protein